MATSARSLTKLLKDGAGAWNRWRGSEGHSVRIDLSGARLRDFDLRGVDLRAADLSGADFSGSCLSYACFYAAVLDNAILTKVQAKGTVFTDAHLRSSDLSSANLIGTNLSGATLSGTNLRGADLCVVNLSGAKFAHTDLARAKFWDTALTNIDLTGANLLEPEVQGPCDVGLSTLRRTAASLGASGMRQGQLERFFRACGVAEDEIEYFRSLIGKPIQWYSAFISYSHADRSFAQRTYDHLQARGIRCWLDEHQLKPGQRILDAINQAIRVHDRLLLCCSRASLTSWWVKDELRKALERERREQRDVVIPLDLDGYLLDGWDDGLASEVRSRLAANFKGWETSNRDFEIAFERVVTALRVHGRL